LIFFGSKIAIYLSLGLHRERPCYRSSLQLSKENIQHFKTYNSLLYLFPFLCVIFALLDPDSESGSTDMTESGSETLIISEGKMDFRIEKRRIIV
jgi:hypothetical protein